jgi:hypothetical protein
MALLSATPAGPASAAYGPPTKPKTIKAQIKVSNAVNGYRLLTARVYGTKKGSVFTVMVGNRVVHRGQLKSSSVTVRLILKLKRGDRVTIRSGGKILASLRI